MTVRVCAYYRASQDRDGLRYSVERQREDVHRLCASRDWTLAAEFTDNDVSATGRKPRPAFTEMMRRVDAGEFDVICARHMDRLLRRISELESVLDRCRATHTHIVTASDSVDTSTDGGRLVARILASVGQGEVERKSARQRSAIAQAAKQGRWHGGPRPFGYEDDGITVRESEAALIRQGYADIVAGKTASYVARRWNETGITTPRGRAWTLSAVKDVLTNPRNSGQRRRRSTEDRDDIRSNPLAGIAGDAEWPALVNKTTFRSAVRLLCNPARRTGGNHPQGLLTGVALCGVCELTVHRGRTAGGDAQYRCRSNRHVARRAEPVDKWVSEVAIAALSKPGAAQLFNPSVDTAALTAQADQLRSRLADLDEDYSRMDPARWRAINDQIQAELAEVETKLSAVPQSPAMKMATAKNPRQVWKSFTVAQQRTVIETVMDVRIYPPGKGVRTFDESTVVCTPKVPS